MTQADNLALAKEEGILSAEELCRWSTSAFSDVDLAPGFPNVAWACQTRLAVFSETRRCYQNTDLR